MRQDPKVKSNGNVSRDGYYPVVIRAMYLKCMLGSIPGFSANAP